MAAKKPETAEQKLLKMIEASAGPAAVAPKAAVKTEKKRGILSMLKMGNKVLMGVVILTGVLLVGEVMSGAIFLRKNVQFDDQHEVVQSAKAADSFFLTIEGLAHYLSGVKQRNLFKPFEKKVKSVVSVTKKNRRIVQKTENFRLVGVSWLDTVDTASVMIEDTDKKITHFLQEGEKIGDIFIKTIYADSVELGYENEEIIIRYDKSQM